MGLFDTSTADQGMPSAPYSKFNPETEDLLQRANKRAFESPQEIANKWTTGYSDITKEGRQSLSQLPQTMAASALPTGGADPALSQALTRRAERSYGTDINKLKLAANFQAEQEKRSRLTHAANLAQQEDKFTMQQAMRHNQEILARAQARNQAKSSVLGFLGTAAGAIIGGLGGPPGAVAGAALGKAATSSSLSLGADIQLPNYGSQERMGF